jgi:hypothetical protein
LTIRKIFTVKLPLELKGRWRSLRGGSDRVTSKALMARKIRRLRQKRTLSG